MGINFYVLCLLIACFSGDVIDRTMMSRVSKSIYKIKEKYRKASKGIKILVTKRTITGKEEKNESYYWNYWHKLRTIDQPDVIDVYGTSFCERRDD